MWALLWGQRRNPHSELLGYPSLGFLLGNRLMGHLYAKQYLAGLKSSINPPWNPRLDPLQATKKGRGHCRAKDTACKTKGHFGPEDINNVVCKSRSIAVLCYCLL